MQRLKISISYHFSQIIFVFQNQGENATKFKFLTISLKEILSVKKSGENTPCPSPMTSLTISPMLVQRMWPTGLRSNKPIVTTTYKEDTSRPNNTIAAM